MPERDEKLLDFATPRQSEVLRIWWGNGSMDKAAAVLGVHRSLFGKTLKARAAKVWKFHKRNCPACSAQEGASETSESAEPHD